jgi:hypothetical protein
VLSLRGSVEQIIWNGLPGHSDRREQPKIVALRACHYKRPNRVSVLSHRRAALAEVIASRERFNGAFTHGLSLGAQIL